MVEKHNTNRINASFLLNNTNFIILDYLDPTNYCAFGVDDAPEDLTGCAPGCPKKELLTRL